jgi:hypothetical protein
VDPRASLEDVEKRKFLTLLGIELRPLGRPARSESLYGLRYRGMKKSEQSLETHVSGFKEFTSKEKEVHNKQKLRMILQD